MVSSNFDYNLVLLTQSPPAVSSQPQPVSIFSDQSTTLAVQATQGVSYQWYKGNSGDSSQPISGATWAWFSTPVLAQTNSYWVKISNSAGSINSATATVTVTPATFTQWATNMGLAGNAALPGSTPFNDTIPNLAHYAMNLGSSPDSMQLPQTTTQSINGVPCLTIQYRQNKNMVGVQLLVQYSYDLTNWANLPAQNITQLADDDSATARYQGFIVLPSNGTVFMRIQTNQGL
jgi:hypothetical protein